jgi:apolipoprotein N-acyltransferase
VLVVQTNNATYNGTHQPYQQMAMSRLRAVETGRDVLVASTSGISAVVRADGSVAQQAPEKVARTLVARVPLRDGRTLSTRLGAGPERLLAVAGLLAAATGLVLQRRRRRAEDSA